MEHNMLVIRTLNSSCTNFLNFFFIYMQQENGRPLPKFGEWDVNNPASAEGFTVIFNKARDEKKTNTATATPTPRRSDPVFKNENYNNPQYSGKVNLNSQN